MALLDENATLFAHKALNLTASPKEVTKRVAGAVVGDCNTSTGKPDPEADHLANLFGLDLVAKWFLANWHDAESPIFPALGCRFKLTDRELVAGVLWASIVKNARRKAGGAE
ncbi:hypothetical protein SAMN05880590_111100 [Rhizobium sp. RU35A]|uniref:hypothetical protein n=1 Tax=Rhizobium sp. RU35A TaxID=1907414 RepID=UPI00095469DA|nr:hypothetical protein [Rhizobium sp. RU35A]SIR06769.1 hypothetical protein SAMN05880590_111100 [Rhizobium sp. RU35A]